MSKSYRCDACGQYISGTPPGAFMLMNGTRASLIVNVVEDLCSKDVEKLLTRAAQERPWAEARSPLRRIVLGAPLSSPAAPTSRGDVELTLPE